MSLYQTKVSYTKLLSFFLLCLSPLISFLYSIYLVIKRKNFSLIIISIPISLIFLSMPWASDTISNFKTYLSEGYLSSDSLYINTAQYLKYNFKFDFYLFYFFTLVVIFYSKFYFIKKYNELNLNSYIFFLVVLFLTISYRDISDLNRTYLACSIFIVAYYLYVFEKKIVLPFFLVFVAVNIHSFVFLAFFISVLANIFKEIKFKYFILCMVVAFQSNFILNYLVNNISFISEYSYYITGERWGLMKLLPGNIIMRVADLLVIFSFLYVYRQYARSKIYKFIFFLSVLIVSFLMYRTFYERTIILFYISIPMLLFLGKDIKMKYKVIMVILLLLRFLFYNVYTHGYILYRYLDVICYYNFYVDNIVKLFYLPCLLYLNNSNFTDLEIYKIYFQVI